MQKKMLMFSLAIMVSMFATVFSPASAQVNTGEIDVWGLDNNGVDLDENYLTDATNLGEKDPRAMASSIINIMLGFLGIIAVVIILLGGFKWMTAGGNDDGIAQAKKLLSAGVIGLIIILMSYGLAQFVLSALVGAIEE